MYNENVKVRYIEEKTAKTIVNKYQLPSLFNKTELFEKQLRKDVSLFSKYEALDMLRSMKFRSIPSIKVAVTYLSDYTEWCIGNEITSAKKNHFNRTEITQDTLASCISVFNSGIQIVDKEEVLRWCSVVANPSDKVIMLGMFEGIKGKNFMELLNLRKEDINEEKFTVCLFDRANPLPVSETLVDYMIESAEEMFGYGPMGGKQYKFVESDLVIKEMPQSNPLSSDLQKSRRIYNRTRNVFAELGVEWMTTNALTESGIVYMLLEDSKVAGRTWREMICDNDYRNLLIDRFQKTFYAKQFILKYEKILGD